MNTRALLIGPEERAKLNALAMLARSRPVNVITLKERLKNGQEKVRHMTQMTEQSIELPVGYSVTYSVETGHPIGLCHHMSISVDDPEKMPNPHAIWMVAQELGFWGQIQDVDGLWREQLTQGMAINLVQRVAPPQGAKK